MYKTVPYPMIPFPKFLMYAVIVLIPSVIIHFLIFIIHPISNEICVASFFGIVLVWVIVLFAIWSILKKRQVEETEEEEDLDEKLETLLES